jgi:hypothetical protein
MSGNLTAELYYHIKLSVNYKYINMKAKKEYKHRQVQRGHELYTALYFQIGVLHRTKHSPYLYVSYFFLRQSQTVVSTCRLPQSTPMNQMSERIWLSVKQFKQTYVDYIHTYIHIYKMIFISTYSIMLCNEIHSQLLLYVYIYVYICI